MEDAFKRLISVGVSSEQFLRITYSLSYFTLRRTISHVNLQVGLRCISGHLKFSKCELPTLVGIAIEFSGR